MFGNVGWGELLVLLVVGLVVLGPERLPGAIQWTTNTLRQVRDYASGATASLREELGPEFEDMRQPLAELQKLRGMSPRAVITKHLLDGDSSMIDSVSDALRGGASAVIKPPEDDTPTLTGPGDEVPKPVEPQQNGQTRYDADAT